MSTTVLDIDNVSVSFGNEQAAVSEVTLEIYEKDKVAVIGETGSGKSVLLLAILKLLPGSANIRGNIRLEGEELFQKTEREMSRLRGSRIAYIPQGSGNGLNPLIRIGKQITEGIREHTDISRKSAEKQAIGLLKEFGFDDSKKIAGSYPFTLSGGMRQRALIAMGIAADAGLILADEPTKGLDYARIEMVVDAFRKLEDRTVLCVTHDLRFAKAVATRISVMYASQQIENCTSEEFFSNPLHPYSKAMLAALPENGLNANMGFAPPKAAEEMRQGCHFKDRCMYKTDQCEQEKPIMQSVGSRKVRCWNYAACGTAASDKRI